jgi:hypothetical protein
LEAWVKLFSSSRRLEQTAPTYPQATHVSTRERTLIAPLAFLIALCVSNFFILYHLSPRLLLPDYGDDYDKLENLLGCAILECEGFGLE